MTIHLIPQENRLQENFQSKQEQIGKNFSFYLLYLLHPIYKQA